MERTVDEVYEEIQNIEIIKKLGVYPITKYVDFFGNIILLDFFDPDAIKKK